MKYNNYNPEKKDKSKQDIYFKAIGLGILLALSLISGGKILILIVNTIFKYWTWALGIAVGLFLIKHLFGKKNKRTQQLRRPDY